MSKKEIIICKGCLEIQKTNPRILVFSFKNDKIGKQQYRVHKKVYHPKKEK